MRESRDTEIDQIKMVNHQGFNEVRGLGGGGERRETSDHAPLSRHEYRRRRGRGERKRDLKQYLTIPWPRLGLYYFSISSHVKTHSPPSYRYKLKSQVRLRTKSRA